MATTPALSFVVTCKGRLAQLQATLPSLLAQPDCECIVVDYDCPQGSGKWVREHHPAAQLVAVRDEPIFQLSRARNQGAAVARGDWLCFIDVDVAVAPEFSAAVIPLLNDRGFLRPEPLPVDASGTVICRRDDFASLEGYDEAIEGWGSEDDDIYARLRFLGRQQGGFPARLLGTIRHDDQQRTAFYAMHDRWRNQRINSFYLHVKFDLMRQLGMQALTLEIRKGIYREISNSFLANPQSDTSATQFEVNLPLRHEAPVQAGWHIERRWVYRMMPSSIT